MGTCENLGELEGTSNGNENLGEGFGERLMRTCGLWRVLFLGKVRAPCRSEEKRAAAGEEPT